MFFKYHQIYRKIKKFDTIVIARHVGPDPDALGSTLCLKDSIQATFPKKKVYAVGLGAAKFRYLGNVDKFDENFYNNSLLIVLDTPDIKRVDGVDVSKFKNKIKIDHHPFIEKFCDIEIVDDTASSASQLVMELIFNTPLKMTKEAAKRLNTNFGIVDLSLAPTPFIGDSVAHILEEMGLESCGAPGTTAALALLNDAVKKGGVMASSSVGGLSGAFIPVSEDLGMIDAAEKGALSLEKLEAMTAVCSVGLDMIAIPGDTTAETISGIIADEMAIGMVNNKTTAVRIIPVPNKTVGEYVEFGGLLGRAPIMPVMNKSAEKFISRGGRIPAPIHGNKN